MNRRDFIGATLSAAGLSLAGCSTPTGSCVPDDGSVRFCVFSDIHYRPGLWPNSTKEWLTRILDHARAEQCDFVIQLGDFCHRPKEDGDYISVFRTCGIPAYHCLGNHEHDKNTYEEVLQAYGLKCGHYHFDCRGFRFVVLDPNYVRRMNGRVEHYSGGNYAPKRQKGKSDVISYVPPEELDWLRQTLEASAHPCVICSHQSLERPFGSSCSNGAAVRAILDEANQRHPGRVLMAMNGHHHCDYLRLLENILYFDVNSATFHWLGSTYAHDKYPESYRKANKGASNILGWDDPLHAIVTLSPGGGISIKGMKSRFSHGVTPADVKYRGDDGRRLATPNISSAELRLGTV